MTEIKIAPLHFVIQDSCGLKCPICGSDGLLKTKELVGLNTKIIEGYECYCFYCKSRGTMLC